MSIPVYEDIKLPALKFFSDGKIHSPRDIDTALAPHFQLTEADMAELLPSGTQTRWSNRVNWACYDLYRAELLQRPKRGHYQITSLGEQTLTKNPTALTREYLESNFPIFREWNRKSRASTNDNKDPVGAKTISDNQTANERIDAAYTELNSALTQDVLDQVRAMNPYKFEQLVVDLLVAMGYGGSRAEAASVTQPSNDEGVDGVIKEDRLGLDTIYIQAKRWQSSVGRRELQSFVGALVGKGANKGVFITSGQFASTAADYVRTIAQKVILIDGDRLAELMIEHGVGVSVERTYTLKRIDSDYFEMS